jgi:hypothetical protein
MPLSMPPPQRDDGNGYHGNGNYSNPDEKRTVGGLQSVGHVTNFFDVVVEIVDTIKNVAARN